MTDVAHPDTDYDDELDDEEFDELEVPEPRTSDRTPWVFAIWLILAGIVGEIAAAALTIEKIHALQTPGSVASCDFNAFVQCTKNLDSWQGSVFGFPNPIIGLICWMAPIVVGVSVLAGARFPRWYWTVFNIGVLGAVVFVIWLAAQSIFASNLRTLCPYCVLTWSVTYPTFLAVTFRNLAAGVFGARGVTVGRALLPWVAPISIVIMLVIFGIAQTQLPVVQSIIQIFS
ncbi:vitamin K epoxide reductase family protein [Protaetiibacter intestinalis]|uniref:Vitamin K epoxide reductase family protein n=1 Tax=Protaetiibacter intestinalis TaxID=2419774 RepID=A0A387B5G9_9MICO|nr:vitamin K epoxide reductase family protein [Protaetiibacter intestinalis]AYF96961.1 vitamin K epoxide reductase family protein [Protaetiibacter intestinalis]